MVGQGEVTRVNISLEESGEKDDRVGDAKIDIGQVESADGWGNEKHMSFIIFTLF